MRSLYIAVVAMFVVAPVFRDPETAPCTQIPDLYQDWKLKTSWSQLPDSVVRQRLDAYRGGVTFDPFDAAIAADAAGRVRLNERVLWEDDSVLVLVAKPAMPRDALVVPRRELMFPLDASDSLLKRMAAVAAAVSDAFIQVAAKRCDGSLHARIWINPPDAIGVRHLHVHVQPPSAIVIQDEQDFYARMSRQLADGLGQRR